MELIVKIPDEAYELLKSKPALDNIAESIIANGTPLPKGHGRLVDEKDLLASLEKDTREAFTKHQVWLMFSVYNEDVPTIIEVNKANMQGKWVKIFENAFVNGYECPFCGHRIQVTEQFLPYVTECEACGSDMRGGAEMRTKENENE